MNCLSFAAFFNIACWVELDLVAEGLHLEGQLQNLASESVIVHVHTSDVIIDPEAVFSASCSLEKSEHRSRSHRIAPLELVEGSLDLVVRARVRARAGGCTDAREEQVHNHARHRTRR